MNQFDISKASLLSRNIILGASITVIATGSMKTVSRFSIIYVSLLFLLLLVIQLVKQNDENILVPVFPDLSNSHPDVILSDPGGPLLVSMAELAMLPPHVLPQLTCSPPPLPR